MMQHSKISYLKKYFAPATFFVLVFVASCKNTQLTNASKVAVPQNDTIVDLSNRKVMKDAELYTSVSDLVQIDTMYIVKDSLHLITARLQACDADNFKLIWNGAMTKSIPPQAGTKLFLMNDASCKEQHAFHLSFNLSPMKAKGDTARSIIVKVSGNKESVLYK